MTSPTKAQVLAWCAKAVFSLAIGAVFGYALVTSYVAEEELRERERMADYRNPLTVESGGVTVPSDGASPSTTTQGGKR